MGEGSTQPFFLEIPGGSGFFFIYFYGLECEIKLILIMMYNFYI